jgi:S1-C subfamily serine protease
MNKFLIVAAIACVTGISLAILDERQRGVHPGDEPIREKAISKATMTASPQPENTSLDLRTLAKRTRNAVVSIEVFDDEKTSIGRGSGFFVSDDGLLVTNYHVIENASRAVAKTATGDEFSIERAAYVDQKNDLAVLAPAILPGKVPFLRLGKSAQIDVGERVAVIGNPLGLEGSLSEGIVSAKRDSRSMVASQASPDAGASGAGGHQWLQVTAAISPGSSGSPVLDASGNVIGVASMKVLGGESLNFAVPAEVVAAMMQTEANQDSTQRRLIPLRELAYASEGAKLKIEQEASLPALKVLVALSNAESAAKLHRVVDWNEVLNLAKALVRKYPQVSVSYARLGDVYRAMGLSDEAIEAYKQAIKLKHDDSSVWKSDLSSVLESLGSVLKGKGRDSEANYAFSQAIAIDRKMIAEPLRPGMADMTVLCLDHIGDTYHSAGNNKAAEEAYLSAIEAGREGVWKIQTAGPLHSLGRLYAEEGYEKKALEMFYRWASLVAKKAKNTRYLKPPEAAAWSELSDFYYDTHNEEASHRCLAKARSLGLEGLE